AEYHAAKEEQGKMEARIRQLDDMLRRAQVGEAPEGDAAAAGMVVTTVDADGDTDTFLLGSREDRVEGMDVVSVASPLGRALVGHRAGDAVTYQAPAGSFSVEIVDVRPLDG
ncbi:MAG: GreA/GreB family elongation factor, partial [Actinobacteria bacterium]|nr:GreA/GreB family elongation factor [Actinomycetota bacterium]